MKNPFQNSNKQSKDESSPVSANPFIQSIPPNNQQVNQPIYPAFQGNVGSVNVNEENQKVISNQNSIQQNVKAENKPICKPKVVFCEYGYIEVNQEELDNPDIKMISFEKPKSKIAGSIAVSNYYIYTLSCII
jgi:hypothetical protein